MFFMLVVFCDFDICIKSIFRRNAWIRPLVLGLEDWDWDSPPLPGNCPIAAWAAWPLHQRWKGDGQLFTAAVEAAEGRGSSGFVEWKEAEENRQAISGNSKASNWVLQGDIRIAWTPFDRDTFSILIQYFLKKILRPSSVHNNKELIRLYSSCLGWSLMQNTKSRLNYYTSITVPSPLFPFLSDLLMHIDNIMS